ncbi:MAG: DUF4229 domain-containing protein [Leucobacter sp.]|nr:DUF4229 domain-containing protein [Leucobacter sp.]
MINQYNSRVTTGKAWLLYSALRLLFFVVPFGLLFFIGWPWWLAMVIAALVSLSLSLIFLSKPRETASTSIYEWRMRDRTQDDIAEDDALDAGVVDGAGVADDAASAAVDAAESAEVEDPSQTQENSHGQH